MDENTLLHFIKKTYQTKCNIIYLLSEYSNIDLIESLIKLEDYRLFLVFNVNSFYIINILAAKNIFNYNLISTFDKILTNKYDLVICSSFNYDISFYKTLNKPDLLIYNVLDNIPSYMNKICTIDSYYYLKFNKQIDDNNNYIKFYRSYNDNKNYLNMQLLNTTDKSLHYKYLDQYFIFTDYLKITKIIHHTEDILPHKLFNNWYLINPSIVQRKNGYLVSYRLSNYCLQYNKQKDTIEHIFLDNYGDSGHNNYSSKILLVKYDFNFNVQSYNILEDSNGPYIKFSLGLEDVRLYHKNYFNATSTMENNKNLNNIVYVHFKHNKVLQRNIISSDNCEKNWLVFKENNQYLNIVTFNPLTIQEINIMGDITFTRLYNFKQQFWRNAAAPILYNWQNKQGYLGLVRESCDHNLDLRTYYYRWIYYIFNNTILTLFISNPWKITKEYVEIINSIILTKDNELLVYYSVNDTTSHLVSVDTNILNESLIHQFTF